MTNTQKLEEAAGLIAEARVILSNYPHLAASLHIVLEAIDFAVNEEDERIAHNDL